MDFMSKHWPQLVEFVRTLPAAENAKTLDLQLPFSEQGIDSLDLAGLFLAIEDKFQVRLLDNPARRPKCFSDILAILDKKPQ
jgi:acyl carrier protein